MRAFTIALLACASIQVVAAALPVRESTVTQASPDVDTCETSNFWPSSWRITFSFYTTCNWFYHIPATPPGLAGKLANISGYTNITLDNTGSTTVDWSVAQTPGDSRLCADTNPSNHIQQCDNIHSFPSPTVPDSQIETLAMHNQGWVASAGIYMTAISYCADGSKIQEDICTKGDTYVSMSDTGVYTWATGGCTVASADPSGCHGGSFCCKNTSSYPTGPLTMCGPTCFDCTGACT